MKTMLEFFGFKVVATLRCDSSAARGMMRREGVGKVKTLEIKTLWLQQKVKSKELLLATEPTLTNKADLGTKILPGPRFEQMRLSNWVRSPAEGVEDYQVEEKSGRISSISGGGATTTTQQLRALLLAVCACLGQSD